MTSSLPTRKEFLQTVTGLALLPTMAAAEPHRQPKVIIVVAHPDDEYAFAATVYRITRELGGIADQVVITNGGGRLSVFGTGGVDLPRFFDPRVGRPGSSSVHSKGGDAAGG